MNQTTDPVLPVLSNKQQRRNLFAHIADGGFYVGATMFLAPGTVLPTLFEKLDAPTWLIALAPQLMILGFLLPSLFVAHIVDRMSRVKPFTVWMGLFQRLPYALVALCFFFIEEPEKNQHLLLTLVVVAILSSGLCGGFAMGSWQELLHRTVPAAQRAGMFAARNALASLLGLVVGLLVERILATFTGMQGYGVLFICTACGLFISYASFWWIKEVPEWKRSQQEKISLWKNLRNSPAIVCSQPGFLLFVIVSILGTVHALVLPFLAIDARKQLGVGDELVGLLLSSQMFGGLLGNVFAGYIGNRWGGRLPFIIGHILLPLSFVIAVCATTAWGYYLCFAVLGFGQFTMMVGQNTLALELAPSEKRATALAVMRTLMAPMIIGISFCAAWLRDYGLPLSTHVWVVIAVAILTLALLCWVPEPRKMPLKS